MWDLPGPGLEPMSPASGRRILNHCTTREVLVSVFSSLMGSTINTSARHAKPLTLWTHPHPDVISRCPHYTLLLCIFKPQCFLHIGVFCFCFVFAENALSLIFQHRGSHTWRTIGTCVFLFELSTFVPAPKDFDSVSGVRSGLIFCKTTTLKWMFTKIQNSVCQWF